jgi:hypothetical protein
MGKGKVLCGLSRRGSIGKVVVAMLLLGGGGGSAVGEKEGRIGPDRK